MARPVHSDAVETQPDRSHAEQIESARNRAIKILTAAPKSRRQLEERLLRADEEPEIVTELLDRLERVGLLDDAQLAAMIVRTRFAERGQTRRAIAQELRRKGLDDVAEAALAQVDDADEAEAAVDVARSRLRRTATLDRPVRIRRALGALGRKGYSSGVAMQAIHRALAEEAAHDDGRPETDGSSEADGIVRSGVGRRRNRDGTPESAGREHEPEPAPGPGSDPEPGLEYDLEPAPEHDADAEVDLDASAPRLRRRGSASARRGDTTADDSWMEPDVGDDGHTV